MKRTGILRRVPVLNFESARKTKVFRALEFGNYKISLSSESAGTGDLTGAFFEAGLAEAAFFLGADFWAGEGPRSAEAAFCVLGADP